MTKCIFILVTLIVFGQSITAQTYYYRYVKSIIKGVTNTNVSGGQFITFDGKKCFESDKYGNNVGNGSMAYDKEVVSNTRMETYWGACYWSKNAYMKFNADRSLMNIETNAGRIYVYKRTTAPTNVTTCSLIREPELPNSGGGGSSSTPVYPMQPTYPQGGYIGSGIDNGSSMSNSIETNRGTTGYQTPVRKPQRKWCRLCGGTGKCRFCDGTGWVHRMGIGHDGYCPSCPNHSGRCSSCNGRGEWYE